MYPKQAEAPSNSRSYYETIINNAKKNDIWNKNRLYKPAAKHGKHSPTRSKIQEKDEKI